MQGSVVVLLDIGKTSVHAWDMYDDLINDLSLTICLGVEGSGFGELGIQQ
jgi:hypothetical protein